MKYFGRKLMYMLDLMAIGYLVSQYFIGNFTDVHFMCLIACVALLLIMAFAKFIRRIIYWPIRMIKKIIFMGWLG
jgi:hypothetical protein